MILSKEYNGLIETEGTQKYRWSVYHVRQWNVYEIRCQKNAKYFVYVYLYINISTYVICMWICICICACICMRWKNTEILQCS
jgi:hypothetical protein